MSFALSDLEKFFDTITSPTIRNDLDKGKIQLPIDSRTYQIRCIQDTLAIILLSYPMVGEKYIFLSIKPYYEDNANNKNEKKYLFISEVLNAACKLK